MFSTIILSTPYHLTSRSARSNGELIFSLSLQAYELADELLRSYDSDEDE